MFEVVKLVMYEIPLLIQQNSMSAFHIEGSFHGHLYPVQSVVARVLSKAKPGPMKQFKNNF